jgi:hypothetical protein
MIQHLPRFRQKLGMQGHTCVSPLLNGKAIAILLCDGVHIALPINLDPSLLPDPQAGSVVKSLIVHNLNDNPRGLFAAKTLWLRGSDGVYERVGIADLPRFLFTLRGERLPAYLHPRKGHLIYSLLDMSLSPSPQMSKLTQSWSAFTGRTSGIVLSSTWWKICFKPEVITLI